MIKLNDKEIAARLREVKVDKKIKSDRAFALSIDADPSFFAKILKGEKSITESYVLELAKKWAVNENWLLHGKGFKYGQIAPQELNGDGPWKDKYITLLEKMLSDSNSEQVAKLVKQNQALLMTLQTGLARLISKAEKKEVREVAHELRKETIANLESVGIL